MTFRVVLATVISLGAAVLLAVQAYSLVDREYRDGVGSLDDGLEEQADALCRRLERAVGASASLGQAHLDTALEWLAEGGAPDPLQVVGFIDGSGSLSYHPTRPGPPRNSDEARCYRLALRGGESYELRGADPRRAIDAYAFYLPRIHDPVRRARLRFRIARCALTAGRGELATPLLTGLLEGHPAASEEGFPIDLLAGLLLVRNAGTAELQGRVRTRLRARHRDLETPLLAALVGKLAPDDAALVQCVTMRRQLERELRAHPEILRERRAVLGDGGLLLRRDVTGEERPVTSAFVLCPVARSGLSTERFTARLTSARGEPTSGAVQRGVRLPSSGERVALLEVSDPRRDERLAALGKKRFSQLALLGILGALLCAAAATLVGAAARHKRLTQVRARLVANVSHELKTPITSIRIFSEMLASDALDEDRTRRFGRMLSAESQRLSQLVENLLDFSRPGDELPPLDMESVEPAPLLEHLAQTFRYRASEEGVEFETDLSSQAGSPLSSNAAAIERIVLNLLDNALKYRRAEDPRIRLALFSKPEEVVIIVEDNGVGIARADRERIFEEFYRARFEDYGVQGSGLGLAISKRLAGRLGARISVSSKKHEGSTFTLALPRGTVQPGELAS